MQSQVDNAYVIYLPRTNRYFCGFGKVNQLKSAWSLAGATFYVSPHDKCRDACTQLAAKGIRHEIKLVSINI